MNRLQLQHTLLALCLPLLGAGLTGCFADDSGADDSGGDDLGNTGAQEEGGESGGYGEEDEGGGTDGSSGGDDWGEESTGSTDGGADEGYGDDTGDDYGEDSSDDQAEETDTDTETDTGDPECDEDSDVVLYLSPDDSNSMSSPVQLRERVLNEGGSTLTGIPIRTWEFMNYYGFEYEPAGDGELALYSAMAPVEGEEARWRMQIGVSSEVMTPEERPPMNVTLVLDTSGSMGGEPIELLRETCRAIAAQLKEGDTVSMVEWNIEDSWTLAGYAVDGPNDPLLLEKVEEIVHGGGTDLYGGLESGYNLAQSVYESDALNRLVLISDGGANAGITDIELIAENAAFGGSDGIYLVGVGVDENSSYNDELMDTVTDAGKGASVFMASEEEVWKVFGDDFESTMAIAARNVQVELSMPPGFEIVKFSGEEFSGDPKEIEPQHLAPNDAMVFHQQVETCAPDLAGPDASIAVKVTWEDPWTFETKELSEAWSIDELTGMDQALLLKGAAVLAYAESMQAYKSAYSDTQKSAALAPAFAAIAPAQAAMPTDADLLEIASVLAALNP
ncbi:VWA domain-containing protein [Pseudenhygromyxa sp. WMMC2535]|uniref:vWA domain-containing protein n=1 Tax=Pseudenhygromyxa sp. WMMC2535 TaxID=2712867 RepID=UPI00155812B1|nr:VWA domain-containing protein [Pseudenhygromyxa sp. WMMC2535]NVB37361.1 VWA domain-containing protein [Pseudenhygromyxa sp. WMMC2535]